MTTEREAAVRVAADLLVSALLELVRAETARRPDADRLLSVAEACQMMGGIGRTRLYGELSARRLRSVKVGRRRLIPESAISAYLEAHGHELR